MSITFIITAGGIGKRMGSEIPKQFLELNGKPILVHTLENLYAFEPIAQFIITLPEDWIGFWQELIQNYSIQIPHKIINGGKERFHSIQNALQEATGEIIAIHDGVRPFVSHATLNCLIEKTKIHHAAIPVLGIQESLREIIGTNSRHVNREKYKLVQTPQCFKNELIKRAYDQPYVNNFTDDASVLEALGHKVELVDGNPENIKITSPLDLEIGKSIRNMKPI